jgi:fatty acid desaturase
MTGDARRTAYVAIMTADYVPESELLHQSTYVHTLRPEIPSSAFEPATSRLLFIPCHVAVIAMTIIAVARGWIPWPVFPIASLVIGASFACLTFVAHEAAHGGIVRGRRARYAVCWIGFLPFGLSPRLWMAWHDRVHHANANAAADPDMYPTLAEYRSNRRIQFFVDAFSLGGRRWRGATSLLLGFSIQSAHQLIAARRYGFLSTRAWSRAITETVLAVALWATLAWLVGGVLFCVVFVAPLLVANAIVMAFILTNHNLSPRVAINDPLVSGLSVTVPRWMEWITLRFGFHVEHHLFPAMSSRHAPSVRALLRQRWPERYQSMSLRRALVELHRTARVYKDAITLVDPRSGAEFATLLPRERLASAL